MFTCLLALPLATPACLVPLPPPQEESPTLPTLSLGLASPPITQLLVVRQNDQIKFSIPVQDTGAEQGKFVFWLNWGLSTQPKNPIEVRDFSPSQTAINYTWRVDASIPTGCQQLTLLVGSESAISYTTPITVKNPDVVAVATWWLNVNPEDGDDTLRNCPAQSGT